MLSVTFRALCMLVMCACVHVCIKSVYVHVCVCVCVCEFVHACVGASVKGVWGIGVPVQSSTLLTLL